MSLDRALVDPPGDHVARIPAAPTGLRLLPARGLAFRLPAGMLAVSHSRVRPEPPPADRARSLPGLWHGDASGHHAAATLSDFSSSCLGQFWKAGLGKFSRAPKPDRDLARQLAEFLEFGCDLTCYVDDGLIGQGQDLISAAEAGLSADVLALLLSPNSSPKRWDRERWEPILVDQARRSDVEVVTVLLDECSFPPLLRRRNFIDATNNRVVARRLLKRWFWQREREPGDLPGTQVSGNLEDLYSVLADRGGRLTVSGADAERFASEAADEFEAVLWAPCHGRTLAQAAGELAAELGLTLDGQVKENCSRIRKLLATRRCLVVLDAPDPEISEELTAGGRTSTAVTRDAVKILETQRTSAYARKLIAARRYAEAYELLYALLDAVIDPDVCARELTWICEHWDRVEEANALRFNYAPPGGEQLALF